WQFIAQVTMFEGRRRGRALRRSGRLVHGRWLHTAVIATSVWIVVSVTGALLGLLLLVLFTGLPLWTISAVTMLCEIALVPLGAIVITLLYGDARAKNEESQSAAGVPAGRLRFA